MTPKDELEILQRDALWLNFVNEYDLVTRADRAYMRALVELFNSQEHSMNLHGRSKTGLRERIADQSAWPLPEPVLHHIGRIVVLKKKLLKLGLHEDAGSEPVPRLVAYEVSQDEFSRLLYCRLTVHKRAWYRERVLQLTKGEFNGSNGWK